ncbi:hypothetical protein KKF55_01760 [Patescibacteria group bacterium]|nr:hypothetical protein [Patescibacteria group bacterium]
MNNVRYKIGLFIGMILVIPFLFLRGEAFSYLQSTVVQGGVLNPILISTCEELQAIRNDLSAYYKLTKDIDCAVSQEWNVDLCTSFESEKECESDVQGSDISTFGSGSKSVLLGQERGNSGCAWSKISVCQGEFYDGCAYQEYDCLEWCNGSEWITSTSCEDPLGFEPVGTFDDPFRGVLDGEGHTILNLLIKRPEVSHVGIFGVVNGGIIENIHLNNVNILGRSNVGGVVGSLLHGRVKDMVLNNVKVSGTFNVGGLAGLSKYENGISAIIRSSISNCMVEGNGGVGGLVGVNDSSLLSILSSTMCSVRGEYNVGGIAGRNAGGELINVYSDIEVEGEIGVAGLVGANENKGVITSAFAAGKVMCGECQYEYVGGLVGRNEDDGIIVKSFYIGEKSGMDDNGKGESLSIKEAGEQQSFVGWDFAETWFMNEKYPSIKALTSADEIMHAMQKKEGINTVDGAEENSNAKADESITYVSGTVYVSEDKPVQDRENMTVAVSVNGNKAIARTQISKAGEYSIAVPAVSQGDLLTLFMEGEIKKAITILRVAQEPLEDINLYYNQLTLASGSGGSLYTTEDILKATTNGGDSHADIDALLIVDDDELALQAGMTLYIPQKSMLDLRGNLKTDGLVLHGVLKQGAYSVTVLGDYVQKSGMFKAGKGNVSFNGDVIIEGGTFLGAQGTVELNDDLVGVFNLQGGEFVAPDLLIIRSKWKQSGGVFKHNDGTVQLRGTSHPLQISDGQPFFNLHIGKENGTRVSIPLESRVEVSNNLVLEDGKIDGGIVLAQDGLKVSQNFDGGDATLKITGSGERVISLSAGAQYPSMEIDAPNVLVKLEEANDADTGLIKIETTIFDKPFVLRNGEFEILDVHVLFHDECNITGGSVVLDGGSIIFDEPFIAKGGLLKAQEGTLAFKKTFVLNGGDIDSGDAVFIFDDNVTIQKGTFNSGKGDVVIGGKFILNGGKFFATTGDLTLAGDIVQKRGVFDHNGGTMILIGETADLAISDMKFTNLSIDKNQNAHVNISSGSVVVSNDLILKKGSMTGSEIIVSGNVVISEKFNTGSLLLKFTGENEQTLMLERPERFQGSINIDKRIGSSVSFLSDFPLTQSGQSISITKGVLDLNGHSMIFSGATLPLSVGSNSKLIIRGNEKIPELDLKVDSTVEYNLVEGPVRIANGNYHNLILDSDRGMIMLLPEDGLYIRGDLSIKGGVLKVDNNKDINLYGSWLHTGGDFISGFGTLKLLGNNSYIEGDNTFFNLEKTAVEDKEMLIVESETTQIINGNLLLTSSGCNLMQVRSSDSSTNWNLHILGRSELKSLDVSGITYKGKMLMCAEECIDRDENENFDFQAQFCEETVEMCSNGEIEEPLEECDDGNLVFGDGCSLLCQIEQGFECKSEPSICFGSCGDGVISGGESCDDIE